MKTPITCFFLVLLFITITNTANSAGNGVLTEISPSNFESKFSPESIKDQNGVIVIPASFINASDKNKYKIPEALKSGFTADVSLVIHRNIFKIPRSYESFIQKSLESKASIEASLLYKSTIENLESENFEPGHPVHGNIITDISLPAVLSSLGSFPENLECKIEIEQTVGVEKKIKLGAKDVLINNSNSTNIQLNLSECNMIFKAIFQDVHLIKATDGKTILVFENYSLVKNYTLEKLKKVSFIIGNPLNFINNQAKKNMSGLLNYINSSAK